MLPRRGLIRGRAILAGLCLLSCRNTPVNKIESSTFHKGGTASVGNKVPNNPGAIEETLCALAGRGGGRPNSISQVGANGEIGLGCERIGSEGNHGESEVGSRLRSAVVRLPRAGVSSGWPKEGDVCLGLTLCFNTI